MRHSVTVAAPLNTVEVPMSTRLLVTALAAIPAFGVLRGAIQAAQNTPAPPSTTQSPPNIQDMMKMHEQMMAQMDAADAKLDALLKDMNAASGDAKVNAMAAVVTELVRQNRSMHEHMGRMHQQMMGGRGMMMNR
jgi:hypothetical protein